MTMAYAYIAHGGPEMERFVELTPPVPGPGQLLVAVHAAGINPVDWKRRAIIPAPDTPPASFPVVLGVEVAGVVAQVGLHTDGFVAGDAVFGNPVAGGYAQYAVLPAKTTAHKPDALSYVDAAALPVAAATAYDAIQLLGLPVGATLLITGVGGGVGVMATQLARRAGVTVVGVASATKKAFVESLGAIHVESGEGVGERVVAAAPDRIDALLDLIGGETLAEVAGLITDRSKLLTVDGQAVNELGAVRVTRTPSRAVLDTLAALVVEGALNPFVTAVFPLDKAPEALRTVEEGHTRGKVVLEIRAERSRAECHDDRAQGSQKEES